MSKLLPFILLACSFASHAQSKQHLVSSSRYMYDNSSFAFTDSADYMYITQQPGYMPKWNRWNSDTSYIYGSSRLTENREVVSFQNGLLLEKLKEQLLSGIWTPQYKQIYTYDANGNITVQEMLHYTTAGSFQKSSITYCTYDAGNHLTEFQYHVTDSDPLNPTYVPNWRNTYTYDAAGKPLEETSYLYQSGMWNATTRVTYSYPSANFIEELKESNNGAGWQTSSKIEKTFDANQYIILQQHLVYSGTVWEITNEHEYTYDANGNMITDEFKELRWNELKPHSLETYTYNSDGNILTSRYQKSNGIIYTDMPGNINTYYYYGFPTNINDVTSFTEGINIYPTPASNNIHIKMDAAQPYHAQLYDAAGRLAKTAHAVGATPIDVHDLPAGNYVLHLHTGGKVMTQKLVIVR